MSSTQTPISVMTPKPKSIVYIDSPNIYWGAKGLGANKLRFDVLVAEVSKDTDLVGARLYGGDKPTLDPFYADLERRGLKVERIAPSKSVDGRLMVQMLMNAIRQEFDIAILASGDRDYQMVLEEVKRMGKQVWVCAFDNTVSPALTMIANRYISLNPLLPRIRFDPPAPSPAAQSVPKS